MDTKARRHDDTTARRHDEESVYTQLFVSSRLRVFVSWLGASLAVALLSSACTPAPMGGSTPASGSVMPASIIDPYLEIQEALAQDSTDNIKANAGKIATAATALGAPAMKIQTSALQLSGSIGAEEADTDIKAVRDRFGALSEALDTYMTGLKLKLPESVAVAFCPMMKKPWIQRGDQLANPYYGKEMPTCGSFR